MNPFRKLQNVADEYQSSRVEPASSLHPGGANFAFADGSVRFLKDTVQSWPLSGIGTYPLDVSDSNGRQILAPGMRVGVYQKLATRAGGELVDHNSL